MPTDCGCDAWKDGTAQINAALFQWTNHGNKYTGLPYIFCPWCGTKILGEDGVSVADLALDKTRK